MDARPPCSSLPPAASAPVAFASSSSPVFSIADAFGWWAAESSPPWGSPRTPPLLPPLPPATLGEARALRDALTRLIAGERQASADFLLALADFDQRRGWEALGHRSLFDFLKRELRLSSGAASHRSAAARLIPRFPPVEAALRAGDLCLSSLHHLARVIRPENQADLLPRFFGLSAREAEALAAELLPRTVQPRREVITLLAPARPVHTCELARPEGGSSHTTPGATTTTTTGAATATAADAPCPTESAAATAAPGPTATATVADAPDPAPATNRTAAPPPPQVELLSADLRRLHLTVSTRLLGKLESARAGLAHAAPGASTEEVLEVALDLLLEKQAKRKGGRAAHLASRAQDHAPCPSAAPTSSAALAAPALPLRPSRHVPAAVRREVWARDGGRCQFPLDGGGTCGSTHRLELDHQVPLALGGPSTAANLRVVCAAHNRFAARAVLGDALVEDQRSRALRWRSGAARAGILHPR